MIKVREKSKEEKTELPLRQRNQKIDAIVKAIGTSDRFSFKYAANIVLDAFIKLRNSR